MLAIGFKIHKLEYLEDFLKEHAAPQEHLSKNFFMWFTWFDPL